MLVFLTLALCAQATLITAKDPDWNGLQVTWGVNLLKIGWNFNDIPRTKEEADKAGWTKIDDCDLTKPWRGQRYVLDGDYAVILLFDVNGYIAGIQSSISKSQGYPTAALRPPFVDDGDRYTISAYFVDPEIICTSGRTKRDFKRQGTGRGLYLQKTDRPEDSVRIPLRERRVDRTEWGGGKCFYTMGNHYWNRFSPDMDCSASYPVFLLYNGGKLNGFGWAFNTGLTSQRFEHPTPRTFGWFIKNPPRCLSESGSLSTMHIYMTKNVLWNFC